MAKNSGLVILILVFILLFYVACRPTRRTVTTPVGEIEYPYVTGTTWNHIKSPYTNRCYEIVSWSIGHAGWAGMAEIPCEEAILLKEK